MSTEKLYNVYYGILTRCNDKSHRDYKWYGARGIRCLFEGYAAFKEWALANGYVEGLHIDRINSNGHYEPSNCRFITCKENNRNKRNNITVEYDGEKRTLTEWCELAGVRREDMYRRIGRYNWPPEMVVKEIMGGLHAVKV